MATSAEIGEVAGGSVDAWRDGASARVANETPHPGQNLDVGPRRVPHWSQKFMILFPHDVVVAPSVVR